jgi:hypothetical protein
MSRLDISKVADPWVVQSPWMTPVEIRDNLNDQVAVGIAEFFWSKDGMTCWFVRRCTNRVADIHLFSKAQNIIRNCREIQAAVWANTAYEKLEMRTHLPAVGSLARRIGWEYEGTRKLSFELKNGDIVDEILYGVLRWVTH